MIGLGNPGSQYQGTRHNLGFEVVDLISHLLSIPLRLGEGDYLIGFGNTGSQRIGLVKPLTYMNNSGNAVADLQSRFNVPLEKLLVVCDDFQLPLGTLRLRTRGSDGGHNGLYSIIYHLKSDRFPRLRLGIASESMPSSKALLADFVLSPFTPGEQEIARTMVKRAADAVIVAAEHGLVTAMNQFNRKPR